MSAREKMATTGTPVASMASKPPSERSTRTKANATFPPSARIFSIASRVEPPVVMVSSTTTTVSPA